MLPSFSRLTYSIHNIGKKSVMSGDNCWPFKNTHISHLITSVFYLLITTYQVSTLQGMVAGYLRTVFSGNNFIVRSVHNGEIEQELLSNRVDVTTSQKLVINSLTKTITTMKEMVKLKHVQFTKR